VEPGRPKTPHSILNPVDQTSYRRWLQSATGDTMPRPSRARQPADIPRQTTPAAARIPTAVGHEKSPLSRTPPTPCSTVGQTLALGSKRATSSWPCPENRHIVSTKYTTTRAGSNRDRYCARPTSAITPSINPGGNVVVNTPIPIRSETLSPGNDLTCPAHCTPTQRAKTP
jgi:hypothetical protein